MSVQAYSNPSAPVSNAVNFTIAPVPPLTLDSVLPSLIAAGGSALIADRSRTVFCAERGHLMEWDRPGDEPSVEYRAARDRACNCYCDGRVGIDYRPESGRHHGHFCGPARKQFENRCKQQDPPQTEEALAPC